MLKTNEIKAILGCTLHDVSKIAAGMGWEQHRVKGGFYMYDVTAEELHEYLTTGRTVVDQAECLLAVDLISRGWHGLHK